MVDSHVVASGLGIGESLAGLCAAVTRARRCYAGAASRGRSRRSERADTDRAVSTPESNAAGGMHGTTPPEVEDRSGFATVGAETWREGLRLLEAPASAPRVLAAAAGLLGAVARSGKCEAWAEEGLLPTRLASECASVLIVCSVPAARLHCMYPANTRQLFRIQGRTRRWPSRGLLQAAARLPPFQGWKHIRSDIT